MTFTKIINWFKRKPKFKAFPNNEIAKEAFRYKGKVYYHFADNFKIPTGRGLCAIAIYEELRMRCSVDYLEKHCKAIDILLNPTDKKIMLTEIAQIHNNLKERLALAPFPDHIYKLASVIFFDETENPFSYDFEYNKKKIEEWKKDSELLDFFLTMQFTDLMPIGSISKEQRQAYLKTTELIDKIHQQKIQDILFKKD